MSTKYSTRFYSADQFLGGYFYQCWYEDTSDPNEVVANYIKDAPRETRLKAMQELRTINAEFQGPELFRVMLEMGCFYTPGRGQDDQLRKWLEEVIAKLEESLNEADSTGK